jgi:homocysteine S-methyltransferase
VENGREQGQLGPIGLFLERQGILLLDGGLATELEARGADLDDPLWSAKALLEQPHLVRQVHSDYLRAGADCISSASYQASIPRLVERGLSEGDAAAVLRRSVELALEARDAFWDDAANRSGRMRPLVAASVGPYGAFLADGSEYRGEYGVSTDELRDFHAERWSILAASGADVMACETLPSRPEARVLLELLHETPDMHAWFSFTCRDAQHLSDGSSLAETVAELEAEPRVAALGANCVAPTLVPALIAELRSASTKPIVVYPNSGEAYDAAAKRWIGEAAPVDFGRAGAEWRAAGATLIGGCCRTGPGHVREMRQSLLASA